MERVNRLLAAPAFGEHLARIEKMEAQRHFCRHHLAHSLDVARLCWIFLLEAGVEAGEAVPRDVVYGAALLHDLGRGLEDDATGCHAARSAELAEPLLEAAGYTREERRLMADAIREHRRGEGEEFSSSLGYYLRRADKHSRLCFQCRARQACYKLEEMPQGRELLY